MAKIVEELENHLGDYSIFNDVTGSTDLRKWFPENPSDVLYAEVQEEFDKKRTQVAVITKSHYVIMDITHSGDLTYCAWKIDSLGCFKATHSSKTTVLIIPLIPCADEKDKNEPPRKTISITNKKQEHMQRENDKDVWIFGDLFTVLKNFT